MRNLKAFILSLLVFFVSGYVLNFMPVIKSQTCGCEMSEAHYVSLNYIATCFCSAGNGDDFPALLKSEWVVYLLILAPLFFAVLGFKYFKKIIN